MSNRSILLALWIGAVALLIPTLAGACAVCWIGGSSPDHDATARGFYFGLLFLMAMPFAVVGSIAGWLFYMYRRAHGSRKKVPVQRLAWTERDQPLPRHPGVVEPEPGYRKEGGN